MEMRTTTVKRNTALDIIRCFALFFVVSVHFFREMGYYDAPMQGTAMFLMTLIRTVSMICIPLFLMLTGYLNKSQQLNGKTLKKLGTILLTYLLASVFCYGYSVTCLKQSFSVFDFLQNLFSYSAVPYGWYVGMYVGLALLAPFFNTLFRNLDKKGRQNLILVLVFLSIGPSFLNLFLPLAPDYWLSLFPFAFYFLGAYIREYPPSFSTKFYVLQLCFVCVISGYYNFHRAHNGAFVDGMVNDYHAIAHLLIAVLFFCFILQWDTSKFSPGFSRFLEKVSRLTFGAYLVSWVYDTAFYGVLNNRISSVEQRFLYYPVMVFAVYTASLLTSWIITKIHENIEQILKHLGEIPKKFTLR